MHVYVCWAFILAAHAKHLHGLKSTVLYSDTNHSSGVTKNNSPRSFIFSVIVNHRNDTYLADMTRIFVHVSPVKYEHGSSALTDSCEMSNVPKEWKYWTRL